MVKFKVGDYVIGNELANEEYSVTVKGWIGKVATVYDDTLIGVRGISEKEEYCVCSNCFDLYEGSASLKFTLLNSSQTTSTLGISDIKVIGGERNEYTMVNGKRNKATKVTVPTTSVSIALSDGRTGTATCDTSEFDIRTGVLTAIANIVFDGKFETVYEKYNKKQEKLAKETDRIEHTCSVCGKTYDTAEKQELAKRLTQTARSRSTKTISSARKQREELPKLKEKAESKK